MSGLEVVPLPPTGCDVFDQALWTVHVETIALIALTELVSTLNRWMLEGAPETLLVEKADALDTINQLLRAEMDRWTGNEHAVD